MNNKDVAEVKDFFAWLTEIINSFIAMFASFFGGSSEE